MCPACNAMVAPCKSPTCRLGKKNLELLNRDRTPVQPPGPPDPPPEPKRNTVIDTRDRLTRSNGLGNTMPPSQNNNANCRNCGPVRANPAPTPPRPVVDMAALRDEQRRLNLDRQSATGVKAEWLAKKIELNNKIAQLQGLANRRPRLKAEIDAAINTAMDIKRRADGLMAKADDLGKVALNALKKFVPNALQRQVKVLGASALGPQAGAAMEAYQTGATVVEGTQMGASFLGTGSVLLEEAGALLTEYNALLRTIAKLTIP